ncbi:MAG: phosphoglucosamine mutase [Candidatus Aminicenantes bacterium]|nr:MAG: phosphoglucosamine mutase [Candidatus Aminicenantes bacterium]
MTKFFGTDGMRGVAGQFPMDYSTVCALGEALVELLQQEGLPPKVIIGRDTRVSGKWLEKALFQGVGSKNGEIVSAGIIPTSAVSYLTKMHDFSAGIIISASHNPYQDNGIKIFSAAGMKIPEAWEKRLEDGIQRLQRPIEPEMITVDPEPTLGQKYTEFLLGCFSEENQNRNLKIVLDCSNGASSAIAPFIFQWLGFETVAINSSPDGKNINLGCGSLHPEILARHVTEAKADIGIAYDGDADRAIWVDENGQVLNGDHTLFVQCRFMKEKGRLKSDKVVATTMSNMGLEKALKKLNFTLVRADVGDRFVLEEMIKLGANLGGEQSGHTIFLDDCPTGDGILTSVKMVEAMTVKKAPLSELVSDYQVYPQIHSNVPVSKKDDFSLYPEIVKTIEEIENHLGDDGRFNLRYSGTEPLARIMVEGQDQKELEDLANRMARVLSKHLT